MGHPAPGRWDERVEPARGVTFCRAGHWCVLVCRGAWTMPGGSQLDGDEIDLPREIARGTHQLARAEREYLVVRGAADGG